MYKGREEMLFMYITTGARRGIAAARSWYTMNNEGTPSMENNIMHPNIMQDGEITDLKMVDINPAPPPSSGPPPNAPPPHSVRPGCLAAAPPTPPLELPSMISCMLEEVPPVKNLVMYMPRVRPQHQKNHPR